MSGSAFTLSARTLRRSRIASPEIDEFVGSDDRGLIQFAIARMSESVRTLESLLLYGPTGTGKSLLANILAERWHSQPGNGRVQVWTGSDFARAVAHAIDTDGLDDFRHRLNQLRLVIIDGIEELAGKSTAQLEICQYLDRLPEFENRILFTARRLPGEIGGLNPRFVSRLSSGLAIPMTAPGPAARRILLTRLARLHGIQFHESAIDLLADGMPGLLPLHCTVLQMNQLLLALAQRIAGQVQAVSVEQLQSSFEKVDNEIPRLRAICKEVASLFGVRLNDLTGPSRRQGVVRARGVAIYLCRQLTRMSLDAIGAEFGGRDHTTVMHACRKTEELLSIDGALRDAIEKMRVLS